MPASVALGPERGTITERLAGLFHLPYFLGCLFLTVLIGFPGSLLFSYLDTRNVETAFNLGIQYGGFVTAPIRSESQVQGIVRVALYNLFLFFAIYITRSLRMRVVAAEDELSLLSPSGERGFHEAFGGVSNVAGAVGLGVIFGLSYALPRVLTSTGIFIQVFSAIGSSLNAVLLASAF